MAENGGGLVFLSPWGSGLLQVLSIPGLQAFVVGRVTVYDVRGLLAGQ